ncbi:MAG: protease modulator HflC [Chloroflexi bacterium]|nr:protease modulator HflC [Chloroflexota bacterium]|tara:strand:+ start:46245 stop:47102 length:858 start_codon:yes stop_codon:yes gene_type:complete
MRFITIFFPLLIILSIIIAGQALFVVDETETAIVTRFGDPIRPSITSPGLYAKTPFIDTVTKFDKRNTLFDAAPDSLLTSDKKRLIIDAYAIGKIVDPLQFFKTVKTPRGAVTAATGIIASDLRSEIANDLQIDVIKSNRQKIMEAVTIASAEKIIDFGIQISDIRVKRADFPDETLNAIYDRMRAERARKANEERAEGEKRSLEIRAEVDKQATVIESEAIKKSNQIMGEGDAEAIKIYADALEKDPEFFDFTKSLEVYTKILKDNSTIILSLDSDLFKYMTQE